MPFSGCSALHGVYLHLISKKKTKKVKIVKKLHVKFELQGSEKLWKLVEKQYSGQS